jgi:hypothetical protein
MGSLGIDWVIVRRRRELEPRQQVFAGAKRQRTVVLVADFGVDSGVDSVIE